GGPPAYPGAVVASIVTGREMAGSALVSVMTPATEKLMDVPVPGGAVLARRMAARSDPGPAFRRLFTTAERGIAAACPNVTGRVTAAPAGRVVARDAATARHAPDAITARAAGRERSWDTPRDKGRRRAVRTNIASLLPYPL